MRKYHSDDTFALREGRRDLFAFDPIAASWSQGKEDTRTRSLVSFDRFYPFINCIDENTISTHRWCQWSSEAMCRRGRKSEISASSKLHRSETTPRGTILPAVERDPHVSNESQGRNHSTPAGARSARNFAEMIITPIIIGDERSEADPSSLALESRDAFKHE